MQLITKFIFLLDQFHATIAKMIYGLANLPTYLGTYLSRQY